MKFKFYKQFGLCYNEGDFSSLERFLQKDCTYQSFDYLYVIKGREKIIDLFENQSRQSLEFDDTNIADVYSGYYSKSFLWLKTVTECLIFVSRNDKKSIRILSFNNIFSCI